MSPIRVLHVWAVHVWAVQACLLQMDTVQAWQTLAVLQ